MDAAQREYPSAGFLDDKSLFVSDGYGTLYALSIPTTGTAELVGTFELAIPAAYGSSRGQVPFRIHHVAQTSQEEAVLVLSSKHYPREPDTVASNDTPTGGRTHVRGSTFDIWAVRFALPITPLPDQSRPLDILWHRRGDDVPIYTHYDAVRRSFLLVGAPYNAIKFDPSPAYTPTPDELAPIPRANENFEGTAPQPNAPPKPPPYSWTQTSDSVTIAIPLPSTTPTDAIKVAFSLRTLTVFVKSPGADEDQPPVPLPRYDMKPLWDHIQPTTSMWTFDRAAERRYGVLTLHLDKAHEGTRWTQVFAATGATAPSGMTSEEEEVPETLDPSELYAIREALEKYTSALQTGEDASGLGLGRGVPSLAKEELDDDLDVNVGRTACVTWVGVGGSGVVEHDDDAPLQVLSTPFPGADDTPGLVVKNGLDGIVYELGATNGPGEKPAWRHISTYSALAFVLASKRDTRFTFHASSQAVLAFESGSSDLGGNVYIYRGAPVQEKWAKQAVLKVGGGPAGSLLGISLVKAGLNAEPIILCLCEGELILLRNVL